MKTFILLSILFSLFFKEAVSQSILLTENVEASFFSEARFENIEAVSKSGTSAINRANREVAFKIPIQSFDFRKKLMQEHFNENYLESDKFPNATFKGKIIEDIDLSNDGNYSVTALGKLTVHGVTTDRTITGKIVVKNNQIVLTSSFIVPVSDHNIDIPNDKISNISQNIDVKIKAVYEPKL
jgi:polyisoprenoid-binding protein YceI